MTYAVRSRNGKVLKRFQTRREAEVFVRIRSAARSPDIFQAFDEAVRSRPPEGGVRADGTFVPQPAWQAEASRMYDAFRKTAVRAAKLIPKIASGDESAVVQFRRIREGLYKQHNSFFDRAPGNAALELISNLGAAASVAQEAGFQARQTARTQEMTDVRQREADRIANMTQDQRARWQYEQELKLLKGGR
jgi:hypothetical protein